MAEVVSAANDPNIDNNQQNEKIVDYIGINNNKAYLLDGPLSRAYSSALDELYKKEVDSETGIALETQAIDAIHSQMEMKDKLALMIHFDNAVQNLGLIYGVEKGKATPEDVIEVTDALSVMTPEQKSNSAVIFDTALTNEGSGREADIETIAVNPFEQAMEQLCIRHNVSRYNSLNQFIKLNA